MIRNLQYTDQELIQQCLKGKRKAQHLMYQRYAGKMLALCKRYMGQLEEAEEVMLGGFVKVFERLEQYSGMGSFEGWMRTLMVRESLNALKKRKMDFVDWEEQPDWEQEGPQHIGEDHRELLMEAVEMLPDGYRTVFNMYAIEGYSHQEIAQQLGISENTSKSQLSKARKQLQERIKKLEIVAG